MDASDLTDLVDRIMAPIAGDSRRSWRATLKRRVAVFARGCEVGDSRRSRRATLKHRIMALGRRLPMNWDDGYHPDENLERRRVEWLERWDRYRLRRLIAGSRDAEAERMTAAGLRTAAMVDGWNLREKKDPAHTGEPGGPNDSDENTSKAAHDEYFYRQSRELRNRAASLHERAVDLEKLVSINLLALSEQNQLLKSEVKQLRAYIEFHKMRIQSVEDEDLVRMGEYDDALWAILEDDK